MIPPQVFSLKCGMSYSKICFIKLPFASLMEFLFFFFLQYSFQEEVQKKPLPSAASQCCKLGFFFFSLFCVLDFLLCLVIK